MLRRVAFLESTLAERSVETWTKEEDIREAQKGQADVKEFMLERIQALEGEILHLTAQNSSIKEEMERLIEENDITSKQKRVLVSEVRRLREELSEAIGT